MPVITDHALGVLNDNAAGMYPTETIWYDDDPKQLDKIAPTQPHRRGDLTVVAADAQGKRKVPRLQNLTKYTYERARIRQDVYYTSVDGIWTR